MMQGTIRLVVMALVASHLMWCGVGQGEEKKEEKVGKEQIAGTYKHVPGDQPAFDLRADGAGVVHGGMRGIGDWPCRWDFNEHYQMLVISTVQFRRQYKARLEEGKVKLYEGREVFRKGVNLNALLASPFDQAYRAEEVDVPKENP